MSTSVREPLAARRVCGTCGHLHRPALVRKCNCCRRDIQKGQS